jgi:hypothetical protein
MRLLLSFLFAFAAALPTHAQKPVYAVASIVGDRLMVVVAEKSVGSNIDRNRREFYPLNSPALDNGLILAIQDALQDSDPTAKPILLGVSAKALGETQARALDEGNDSKPLIDAIAPAARKAGATHLILALKHRDDARLRTANGMVGLGKLEGLGFYVDAVMQMVNEQNGERSIGFVAPFAYIRFLLVDLGTGATLREKVVRESHAVANQKATVPWEALPADQKVKLLQQLIRAAVADAVPELLEKP